jgi:hypothetical protein
MAIEIVEFQDREDVYWAMTPKPEIETFEAIYENLRNQDREAVSVGSAPIYGTGTAAAPETVTKANLKEVLQFCVVGLAHNSRLANARLVEAVGRERPSAQLKFEQGFVESYYKDGPLSVIAFTAATEDQPPEWLVEGFVGDSLEPDIHTLPMSSHGIPRIQGSDHDALNDVMNEWYPAT